MHLLLLFFVIMKDLQLVDCSLCSIKWLRILLDFDAPESHSIILIMNDPLPHWMVIDGVVGKLFD